MNKYHDVAFNMFLGIIISIIIFFVLVGIIPEAIDQSEQFNQAIHKQTMQNLSPGRNELPDEQ